MCALPDTAAEAVERRLGHSVTRPIRGPESTPVRASVPRFHHNRRQLRKGYMKGPAAVRYLGLRLPISLAARARQNGTTRAGNRHRGAVR